MKQVKDMTDTLSSRVHPVKTSVARGEDRLRISKSGRINPRLVCLLQPHSSLVESYYRLRHALETMRQSDQGLVVGVTSPEEGDGKTLTAINLAGALAQDSGARVLLIDLDLRQPGIRSYLDVKTLAGPGIVDWINNTELTREQVVRYLPGFNLYVTPSGDKAEFPYELLKSPRLDKLLAHARQHYDFVIVDTPQVLLLPDTELISKMVDGFLIVVKADRTPQKMLEETLNLMAQEKVFGLVFNEVSNMQ